MKLQEVFDQLSYGEFSQISIGGQEAGVINEANHPNMIGHVNLALTALYRRFNLKEKQVVIPLVSEVYTYAVTPGDVLKIEKVATDDDFELNLNLAGDPYSVITPTAKSILVPKLIVEQGSDLPDELKTEGLTLTYRANHEKLTSFMILEIKELELPDSHLMALLYFVASRVHNPIGMVNEFNAGNSWYAKYEGECQRLEQENLQVDRGAGNYRLTANGWV